MTIDEAIKALERQMNSKLAFNYKLHADALALGIEALKRVKDDRYYEIASQKPLPGETE